MMKSTLLVSSVAASILVACSSSGDADLFAKPACGPGTAFVDGQCVVADAAAGDAEPGPDGRSRDGAVEATPDEASVDAGSDAAVSDPCPPATADIINCSNSCGGPSPSCAQVKCDGERLPHDPALVLTNNDVPLILRTPERPGLDPKCPSRSICADPEGTPAYAMAFMLRVLRRDVHVRVEPPWRIAKYESDRPFCAGTIRDRCVYTYEYGAKFMVFTTDPAAPARNVVVEAVADGQLCP